MKSLQKAMAAFVGRRKPMNFAENQRSVCFWRPLGLMGKRSYFYAHFACIGRKISLIYTISRGTAQLCRRACLMTKRESGMYQFNVMKHITLIPIVFSVTVLLSPSALNAQVFSDLSMTDPGNWNVNASQVSPPTPFDFVTNWGVSYTSALGVPQDPYSASTTALQLKVNQTSGEQDGVSVSPVSLVLSNSFVMTFDMWLNYDSGAVTNNSTEVGSYGIASNSTTATWAGVGNGQLFGEVTDLGSIVDYQGYNNGFSIGVTNFVADNQNDTNSYYQGLFPAVPVPSGETALDTNQYGFSYGGSISFQWVKVNVTYIGGVLSESINGHLIASYATASVGSDIFLGMYDINNGSAGTNGLADQNYTLFCNVQVEPVSAIPSTFSGIAGSTNSGSVDGAGTNAEFNGPQGTAVDANYNVYVADTGNSTIRKLVFSEGNWQVSTIAGTPTNSGSADGTNGFALFRNPEGITVDSTDNVYVADTGNSTIRKLVPMGTNYVVSTLAGAAGTNGSADGTNSLARFNNPEGITVDGLGNVYVADTLNDTIRMMTSAGTNWVVRTIAGSAGMIGTNDGMNGLARFYSPEGVTVDNAGNVYVADTTNDIIRKLSLTGTNWIVSTIAGLAGFSGSADGTNSDARFDDPGGITVDSAGNLYVADSANETIRKIIPAGTNWVVGTVAGVAGIAGYADGMGTNALFTFPKGIAVDLSGDLYVDGNTISEGFTVSGGVALLSQNFAQGNQYWINAILGPPSAVTAGAAWGLDGDPPSSLSSDPNYTRYFTTTMQALQFTTLNGWNVPTSQTIQVPAGIVNIVMTNLYYTVVAPVITVNQTSGLNITGTANTSYNIQYSTSLNGPWMPLKTITLQNGLYQIEAWPPPWPAGNNAPATFYRAVWTGN
jgi:NHL repeat-containing protein